MATSRTGTTKYLRNSRLAKHRAKQAGQTRCPICRSHLNYNVPLQPNSAEADHIIPHAQGGTDNLDNLRIICRQCNARLGGKLGAKLTPKRRHKTNYKTINLTTSRQW